MTIDSPNNESYDAKRKRFEIKITRKAYRPLPDGRYNVELMSIVEGQGKHGEVYIFEFKVIGSCSDEFVGRKFNDMISRTATAHNSKLWQVVKALTGASLQTSENFCLLDLIEKECWVDVIQEGHVNKVIGYSATEEDE